MSDQNADSVSPAADLVRRCEADYRDARKHLALAWLSCQRAFEALEAAKAAQYEASPNDSSGAQS